MYKILQFFFVIIYNKKYLSNIKIKKNACFKQKLFLSLTENLTNFKNLFTIYVNF